MIRGQKVDCLSHGFCFMGNFDSSVKAIGKVSTQNKKVISYSLQDSMEIQGVNSKVELALVSKVLRERKNTALMEDGVILIDPATTYIDDEVKIGRDTTIYPNVTLQGNTEIGENSEILSGTRIIDSKIYDNVRIESSVIEESIIENGVTIGPYAHLRPKSHLKENVHIGNFVETKKSILETLKGSGLNNEIQLDLTLARG